MKQLPQNVSNILSRSIPGFHQYRLGANALPVYISENLCSLLQHPLDALISEEADLYAAHIHPADRADYDRFLQEMGQKEQVGTLQYRLIRSDGSQLYVSDTMTSYWMDGTMYGDSVLSDITRLKSENENLRFLSETMPCGFLKYTCEKNPKITYVNDRMLQILGFPEKSGRFDDAQMYLDNIFMMIPAQERRRFSVYLDRVYKHGAPIAGEMTVLRYDGSKAYLFGWVTKSVNAKREAEFQSACIDITDRHNLKKEQLTRRYLKALTEVYDSVFEYDRANRTVKCLHSQNSPMFQWIKNIPMQMEEATEQWIQVNVCQEDQENVRAFFLDFYRDRLQKKDTPAVIQYRALSSVGELKNYSGIFLKVDPGISLFCCRGVPDPREAEDLRSENTTLRNMQELVMRFTDGLAAFEVIGDVVTPLYASDNVCEFFGFTREEWMQVMKKRTPIREFVARSKAAYEDFLVLLETGEGEFTYFDLKTGKNKRIKAICSQRSPASGARYVMLYNVEPSEKTQEKPRVRIRTFGYFDVFVEDKPIAFRNEKSKELFALLADRRGGFVSSEEAISYLWEDEPANSVTLARYRKVALRLKNLLEEYGISDIMESVNGKRRLVTEKVQCDLYDYLSGREEYAHLFKGSYLSNYSWGEYTLGELTGENIYT